MDRKVARIVWNTTGWKCPSGSEGKAGGSTYEGDTGFGHDEWLLDDSRIIDGYHYAFIEPLRKGQHQGNDYQIHFFTINAATKQKLYLGYIDAVHCLSADEAMQAIKEYQQRGWIEAMQEEIAAVNGDASSFGIIEGGSAINILNIRFRMEDVHFLSEPKAIAADDDNTRATYYRLYDYKGDFKLINMETTIYLRKGDQSEDGKLEILDEDRLCFIVRNISRNATGDRTISKALLKEFIAFEQEHPNATPADARETLSGMTNIDKYEYGYDATFLKLAKLNKTFNVREHQSIPSDETHYTKYLRALRTKPFLLLAGISGTGKSRIVRKLAQACITEELQREYDPKSLENGFNRWELHKPANFELVQVKPNWHNSLEVVGYKSNIGGAHYEFTPFVEFVARAWQHPEMPFFLCLDEMNLAPVEQYFAEFLSAIESRSIENGEYETDPIIKPFRDFEDIKDIMLNHLAGNNESLRMRFLNKGLTLPKNLFILGTVNMDETTFSFSRKVLDRAMSIVMNEVDYENFFKGLTEHDVAELSETITSHLINRDIRGLKAEQNDADAVKEYLVAINKVLDNTPFKLGYRAANEALLYVSAAHLIRPVIDTTQALDEFTMMKILSRIEGDKRSIATKLAELAEVITDTYPRSHKKLMEMNKTLEDKQFVSYWA